MNEYKEKKNMVLSLCIPTNGVIEWISQVIDSIYDQDVSEDRFEVVVVDNGENLEFYDYMQRILRIRSNLRYKRIKCPIFMSEIETYKMAKGDFIKFINHRTILLEGTLKKWLDFMVDNAEKRPVVYFANGVLDKYYNVYSYHSFDDFVRNLSYWSSWSTGMAMWKEDVEIINSENCNELFPHTSVLFRNYKNREYVIDNKIYLKEIPHTSKMKGRYDLFFAFSVEYPALLLDLYRKKDITIDTLLNLKDEVLDFVLDQYQIFCEEKQECSYDLNGFEENIQVFYSKTMISERRQKKTLEYEKELERRVSRFKVSLRGKVVYGAGVNGRKYIQNINDEDIICFIDNDTSKQHKLRLGIPVISINDYLALNIEAEVIVCVGEYSRNDINIQLQKRGILYSINERDY